MSDHHPDAGRIALEIRDLYPQFGPRVAVDHLSGTVDADEIVGLVGRNGAGKTTTMRAVMGILRPMGGTILWSGREVTLEDRLRFGYMPEERGLYPQMRVLDQLVYFARLHGMTPAVAREQARAWPVVSPSSRPRDDRGVMGRGQSAAGYPVRLA